MGQPLKRIVALPDAPATEQLAAELASALPGAARGWMILLQGELGAGKSTFARAMLRSLGHSGAVPSPTYTLVEPYSVSGNTIYHIDLYRISDQEELEFLGWSDLADGLRLIEWPERVPGLVDQGDIVVALSYEGDGRIAEIRALSDRAQDVVESLK